MQQKRKNNSTSGNSLDFSHFVGADVHDIGICPSIFTVLDELVFRCYPNRNYQEDAEHELYADKPSDGTGECAHTADFLEQSTDETVNSCK